MRAKGQSEGLLNSPVLPCFFFFLPLSPFTYSHLSIDPTNDTVWGQQTEWGGEWGWGGNVCSLCVSFLLFWHANEKAGFRHGATVPPLPAMTFSPCFAGISLPNHHPWPTPAPSPGLVPVLMCHFDATFGLCVGAFHPSMHSPSVCWPFWSGCINLGRNAASDNPQSNWCVGKSKLSWTCSKRDDPSRPQMSHDCFHPNRLN